jgi:hypothetical protein
MKGKIGKRIAGGLLGIGIAAGAYAIDMPPAEDLMIFGIYKAPLISLEFDTDHDGIGDHKYIYDTEGVAEKGGAILLYPGKLVEYAIDEDRSGRYDDNERFPSEDPAEPKNNHYFPEEKDEGYRSVSK